MRVQIPVVVTAKRGENPLRRRGQGSPAMFVSRRLVGPKAALNRSLPKGKPVYIPVPQRYVRRRKPPIRPL